MNRPIRICTVLLALTACGGNSDKATPDAPRFSTDGGNNPDGNGPQLAGCPVEIEVPGSRGCRYSARSSRVDAHQDDLIAYAYAYADVITLENSHADGDLYFNRNSGAASAS